MIEAKVVFNGNNIIVNDFRIEFGLVTVFIFRGSKLIERGMELEDAIKYCLEHSDDH